MKYLRQIWSKMLVAGLCLAAETSLAQCWTNLGSGMNSEVYALAFDTNDNFDMFPASADFDGDRLADPAVYNSQTGQWYVWLSGSLYRRVGPLAYGIVGSVPTPADFDGDGLADFTVFLAGNWYTWLSTAGYLGFGPFGFGLADALPAAGDFDGDGKADPASYWMGHWFVWLSSINYLCVTATATDDPDAYPVTADFDGDGYCDLATVSRATWYARLSTTGYQKLGPFTFDASGWRFLADDR